MVDRSLATMNLRILAIGPRKDTVSERAAMDTAPSDNMRGRSAPGTVRALAVGVAMRNVLTDTTDTTIITMNGLVRIRIRLPRQCPGY